MMFASFLTSPSIMNHALDITQPPLIPHMVSEQSVVYQGDARTILQILPGKSVQTVVTSPPYWGLRDYGAAAQIGSEDDLRTYIESLVAIFAQVRRILADDGTLWLNLGDSYTSGGRKRRAPDKKNRARAMSYRAPTPPGLKPKDLVGVPWRVAFALQQDGWYLRSEIIWHKPNPHPESVKDRPTRAHETIFLLTKSEKYYYDHQVVREPALNGDVRNKRSVWTVATEPTKEAHFATFPTKLIRPCILAGSKPGDFVLDPFFGSGTTGLVAASLSRYFIGVELQPDYIQIARKRLARHGILFQTRAIASIKDY